jgi:hypothetical protein
MIEDPGNALTFFIVLTVLLFMGLGVAMVVLMDHKARIPGGFVSNPFSIIIWFVSAGRRIPVTTGITRRTLYGKKATFP